MTEKNEELDFFEEIRKFKCPKFIPIDPNNHFNLKKRKKEWNDNISLDFPKTDNISNKPNCHINELIVWKGNPLHYTYLQSVNEDIRDEIAKDLLNYFIDYDFTRIRYDIGMVNRDWENLKKTKVNVKNRILNNTSASGTKIYKYFFPNVLKVSTWGKISVYDALKDRKILFRIIRNRIGNTLLYNTKGREARQWPMSIRPAQILQGAKCSGEASIGSIFKPIVAKIIYDRWVKKGDNVYDFSSGFGTRLLGLMSLDRNNKYFGVEPNTETYHNLIKMSKYFGFNVDIRKIGSEDMKFKEKMNFVFSSPPYYNFERYSNEKSQCYNRFNSYDIWLEKYWRKTVKNIKRMMAKDGVFAVNIGNGANDFMKKIDLDLNRIIVEEGFVLRDTWHMKTSRSHLTNKKKSGVVTKSEGIYFYGC